MSDDLRKNFGDKLKEGVTPDSQKSTFEKGKEAVTDAADNLGKKIQPEEEKGAAQKLADSGSDAKSSAEKSGSSYLDQAKEKIDELSHTAQTQAQPYIEKAQEYVKEAQEYISGKSGSAGTGTGTGSGSV